MRQNYNFRKKDGEKQNISSRVFLLNVIDTLNHIKL